MVSTLSTARRKQEGYTSRVLVHGCRPVGSVRSWRTGRKRTWFGRVDFGPAPERLWSGPTWLQLDNMAGLVCMGAPRHAHRHVRAGVGREVHIDGSYTFCAGGSVPTGSPAHRCQRATRSAGVHIWQPIASACGFAAVQSDHRPVCGWYARQGLCDLVSARCAACATTPLIQPFSPHTYTRLRVMQFR
jgi:hypothetical protein